MHFNFQNEDGFTLIEALLSLAITSFVLLFFTIGITQTKVIKNKIISDSLMISHDKNIISGDPQIEWHLFLNQLEYFLQGSKNPVAKSDLFVVDEWDKDAQTYSKVRYRRPVDTRRVLIKTKKDGTDYFLLGAQRVNFKLEEDGWLIITNSFDGIKEYQGKFRVSSWVNEVDDMEELEEIEELEEEEKELGN